MRTQKNYEAPIPAAAPTKAWVYGRSLTGSAGSNHAGVMGASLL